MVLLGLPLMLEDRTGFNHSTEYDDIYDRMFIGVASSSTTSSSSNNTTSSSPTSSPNSSPTPAPTTKDAPYALRIYSLDRRSSSRGFSSPQATTQMFAGHDPTVVLEFGASGALGSVVFVKRGTREGVNPKVPMAQWIRKTAGSSLTRKFRASDGEEYTWTYESSEEVEWSCTNSSGYVVATYNLKPPGEPAYRSSGNALTVYEAYSHLAIELLASLTIMRHVRQFNL